MPLFSHQIVSHLAPANFEDYVERILSDRHDDVVSELGLTPIEIPFFNASSNLSRLLVLNKLYEVHSAITDAANMHEAQPPCVPVPLQQEISTIIKKVQQTSHHRNNEAFRILDLSYSLDGISNLLLHEHGNMWGLDVKLHPVATSNMVQFDAQPHMDFQVYEVDARRVEAVQEVISKCHV